MSDQQEPYRRTIKDAIAEKLGDDGLKELRKLLRSLTRKTEGKDA